MQVSEDGSLRLSPSDVTAFLACEHLTALQLRAARGEIATPDEENDQTELIKRKGLEHEAAYLDELKQQGLTVREISLDDDRDWERAQRETLEAMRNGVDIVYQGVFASDGWRGLADFLLRQPDGTYEPLDTKLARHAKPAAVLQLCFYSQELGRLSLHPS